MHSVGSYVILSTMDNTEKFERNKELIIKRLSNEKKWSFGELGKFYKIHRTTAEEIFKRDLIKYTDFNFEGSYPQSSL